MITGSCWAVTVWAVIQLWSIPWALEAAQEWSGSWRKYFFIFINWTVRKQLSAWRCAVTVHAWWDASIVQEIIKCVKFSEKLQTNIAPFEYWLLDCQKVVWPKLDQPDRLRCPCILCTQTNHWISMLAKAELGKVYFWLSHVQLSGKTKLDA